MHPALGQGFGDHLEDRGTTDKVIATKKRSAGEGGEGCAASRTSGSVTGGGACGAGAGRPPRSSPQHGGPSRHRESRGAAKNAASRPFYSVGCPLPQASHLLMRPQSLQGQTSTGKGGAFRRPSPWDSLRKSTLHKAGQKPLPLQQRKRTGNRLIFLPNRTPPVKPPSGPALTALSSGAQSLPGNQVITGTRERRAREAGTSLKASRSRGRYASPRDMDQVCP